MKKEITFIENIPVKNFQIYRENGTVQFSIERVESLSTNFDNKSETDKLKELTEKNKYKVCRFDKQGEKIDCDIMSLAKFERLIE